MSAHRVWRQYVNGTVALVASGCGIVQVPQPTIDKLDRDMGSLVLGSAPPEAVGKLVEDGEGVCDRLPLSACGYKAGSYTYYFSDGTLISKSIDFSNENEVGPGGIKLGDTRQDVAKKLVPYVGNITPVAIGNVLHYPLSCLPRLCRLDIQFNDVVIGSLQLSYSDAT